MVNVQTLIYCKLDNYIYFYAQGVIENSCTVCGMIVSFSRNTYTANSHWPPPYWVSLQMSFVLSTCGQLLHKIFCSLVLYWSDSSIFTMANKFDQHTCIKFFVKLGKSVAKTLKMLCQTSGNHSLDKSLAFDWHSHFRTSQMLVQDGVFRALGSVHTCQSGFFQRQL